MMINTVQKIKLDGSLQSWCYLMINTVQEKPLDGPLQS
jgi:hypothetical protein